MVYGFLFTPKLQKRRETITINGTKVPVLITFRRYSAIRPVSAAVASSLAIRLRYMSFFMIYSLYITL